MCLHTRSARGGSVQALCQVITGPGTAHLTKNALTGVEQMVKHIIHRLCPFFHKNTATRFQDK